MTLSDPPKEQISAGTVRATRATRAAGEAACFPHHGTCSRVGVIHSGSVAWSPNDLEHLMGRGTEWPPSADGGSVTGIAHPQDRGHGWGGHRAERVPTAPLYASVSMQVRRGPAPSLFNRLPAPPAGRYSWLARGWGLRQPQTRATGAAAVPAVPCGPRWGGRCALLRSCKAWCGLVTAGIALATRASACLLCRRQIGRIDRSCFLDSPLF